jgi:hypothetical protein
MRELNPVLKTLITGEEPQRKSVKVKVNKLINDVKATAAVSGVDLTTEEITNQAIINALELGKGSNADLRKSLEATAHEPILTVILRKDDTRYAVSEVDEDQYLLLLNVMGRYMEVVEIDGRYENQLVASLERFLWKGDSSRNNHITCPEN